MGRSGEAFRSPDLQEQAARRYAEQQGLDVVEVISDIDQSGRSFQREGLLRLMALARERQIQAVVVYDLSRLGRRTGETLRHIEELRRLGVHVLSTVEKIDDSPEGQFALGVFCGMAQLYGDQVSRRWREVHAAIHEQGGWLGQVPIGYVRTGPRTITPDPETAPAVTAAFEAYARGASTSEVVAGIRAATGRLLYNATVNGMLRNPVYIGRVRSTARGTVHPGRHEALVDEATWGRVQARLAAASYTPKRSLTPRHPFVGLLRCDECGASMNRHATGRLADGTRVERMRCQKAQEGLCAGCGSPSSADLERVVLDKMREHLGQLRTDEAVQAAASARLARAKVDARRLQREAERTRMARVQLTKDFARRLIAAEDYKAAIADLEAEERRLGEQLAVEQHATAVGPPRRATQLMTRILAVWDAATMPERNRLLRGAVRQIRVQRASKWREPLADRVLVEWL